MGTPTVAARHLPPRGGFFECSPSFMIRLGEGAAKWEPLPSLRATSPAGRLFSLWAIELNTKKSISGMM